MIILFSIVFVRFSHVRFFLFYLDSSVAENFPPTLPTPYDYYVVF